MPASLPQGQKGAVDLDDRVDVWLCRDDEVPAEMMTWLDDDEHNRFERFRFQRDRTLFAIAHVFLRQTLSRYAPCDPESWRFISTEFGRPEIAPPFAARGLRFNLSHSQGLVAIVVAHNLDCGVDVERRHRDVEIDLAQVSRAAFAESERAEMLALPAAEQRHRFFELWTLKESYIKARAMGLALPLRKFAFRMTEPISITVEPPIDDRPDEWQFELFSPTKEHQLALSLRKGSRALTVNLSWASLKEQ